MFFLFVLIADQLTKYAAVLRLAFETPRPVVPGFFDLTLVYNKGAAFGMFHDLPDGTRHLVLWGITAVALCVVLWMLFVEAKGDRTSQSALAAILGGALGNIIDRARFDYVVDFLDFYVGTYHWPAFNVADSAISVGVCVLILRMFFPERKELRDNKV